MLNLFIARVRLVFLERNDYVDAHVQQVLDQRLQLLEIYKKDCDEMVIDEHVVHQASDQKLKI